MVKGEGEKSALVQVFAYKNEGQTGELLKALDTRLGGVVRYP